MKAPRGKVIVRERPNCLTVTDVRTSFTQIYRQGQRHVGYGAAAADLQKLSRMGVQVAYL